jgi:hypothetical protein
MRPPSTGAYLRAHPHGLLDTLLPHSRCQCSARRMATNAIAAVITTVISSSFSIVITAIKTQSFNEGCFLLLVYHVHDRLCANTRRRRRQTMCQPLPHRLRGKQRTYLITPQYQPRYLASLQPLASLPTALQHKPCRITAISTAHSHCLYTS